MIDHVGERFPSDRHLQLLHMGKIGLGALTRRMDLLKEHLFLWAMQCFPARNMPAQRAVLSRVIPFRVSFAEQSKECGRWESRIAFELLDDPLPVLFKWIGARLPVMGTLEF